jgi:hypothetical protein
MRLEQQVCSLEIAKRLEKLGVEQKSYLWWSQYGLVGTLSAQWEVTERTDESRYSAFTVAELGELLPVGFRSFSRWGKKNDKDVLVWRCESPTEHIIDQWPIEADTEANVRAKYLAKLIESGAYMRKD